MHHNSDECGKHVCIEQYFMACSESSPTRVQRGEGRGTSSTVYACTDFSDDDCGGK